MDITLNISNDNSCINGILACLGLSVIYVASLYVWRLPFDRDHPSVIKRRFLSVLVITILSPLSVYIGLNKKYYDTATIWKLLGLRWTGLFQAVFLPLFLTMVLFLGPIAMQFYEGMQKLYIQPSYWIANMSTLIWWRNQVVAPFSEEWTFRACMLPLLLQCFSHSSAIFICPWFFGLAHFHHLLEHSKKETNFKIALLKSCFQCAYTTVFGIYAAYLFTRTGHFAAPFTAHSFCNHMGFPDLNELIECEDNSKKRKLLSLFVIGLVSWLLLLSPLTNPKFYENDLFWIDGFSS